MQLSGSLNNLKQIIVHYDTHTHTHTHSTFVYSDDLSTRVFLAKPVGKNYSKILYSLNAIPIPKVPTNAVNALTAITFFTVTQTKQ